MLVFLIGDVAGIITTIWPNPHVPSWVWIMVGVIALVIAQFLAFHRMRLDRDELDKQLLEAKRNRLPQELINKAQEEHLAGVRLHLGRFMEHFLDIDLNLRTYYRDYGQEDTVITEEIHSHFPDATFWQQVQTFKEKASQADSILEGLDKEIQSRSESEVAPLGDRDSKGQCITPIFPKTIVTLAVSSCLGQLDEFHIYEWMPQQSWETYGGNVIAVGIKAETKHRELVSIYTKDKRCEILAELVKDLRVLRKSIFNRMQRCIDDNEYIHHFCSRCHRQGMGLSYRT